MTARIAQFVRESLAGKRLVVVSNREPYVQKKTSAGLRVEQPAGGLTSALDDMLRATGGVWVAWGSGSGDREAADSEDRVAVPPEKPAYTLRRVWLSPSEVENYYHGYANQVLWPLCHIALDRVYFRKKFWEDYVRVNRSFADAVLDEARDDALVWIHDYHLCLAPRFIRERNADAVLAHFWHIPWPDWSVFRVCPQAREILEGLLGNDLIGFQIPAFVKHFLECVEECLGAEIDHRRNTVLWNGRTTALQAFPISIDFAKFDALASAPRTVVAMRELRGRYRLPEQTGVGVDRLEYTKALIKRLQAIALFFERYEKMRGRFTFIQIAVPTRMKEPYLSYREAVEGLIAKINRKYGRGDWKPIVYIDRKVEHRDLAAYYRMADVGVISSIYDGMNLVAKEYAASQIDEKGVLILSEFAGAADELDGALLVNPYDIEGFSTAIKNALAMPDAERKSRMTGLRRHVRENDIYKWIQDVVRELTEIGKAKECRSRYLFDHLEEFHAALGIRGVFLFLDYDGTLAPIADSPEHAAIPHTVHTLLAQLVGRMPLAIVTGRGLDDIEHRVGIEDAVYAANHGSEIRLHGRMLASRHADDDRRRLAELLDRLRTALAPFPGVLIEDKGLTASVHYRKADVRRLGDIEAQFRTVVQDYAERLRVTSGKKVFEIRPKGAWHKGEAVNWILDAMGDGKIGIYIGDDVTDEDAFRALQGRGVSISVGGSAHADYHVREQEEVERVLELLVAWQGAAVP